MVSINTIQTIFLFPLIFKAHAKARGPSAVALFLCPAAPASSPLRSRLRLSEEGYQDQGERCRDTSAAGGQCRRKDLGRGPPCLRSAVQHGTSAPGDGFGSLGLRLGVAGPDRQGFGGRPACVPPSQDLQLAFVAWHSAAGDFTFCLGFCCRGLLAKCVCVG